MNNDLNDTLSDIIDVEDVGNKEKEEKYKNLDTILDDFINVINKQFKEEKDGYTTTIYRTNSTISS